jgi:hypothetical protein
MRCGVCGTADMGNLLLADNRSGTLLVTCGKCHQKWVDLCVGFARKYPKDDRGAKL